MKKTALVSMCVALGCLLSGCVAAPEPGDASAIETPGALPEEGKSAAEVDAKLAVLDVPGGRVIFVDEGRTERGGGIAFWEIGDVNLNYLLEGRNATALEIYLALRPDATDVPARLIEHHREVAGRVPGIPMEPRRFQASLAFPQVNAFTTEPLDDYDSFTDKDCWAWGGTTNPYNAQTGFTSFNETTFQTSFNNHMSGDIPGGVGTSIGLAEVNSDNHPPVTTSAGHLRAMAFCAAWAEPVGNGNSCLGNGVQVDVQVWRTTDAAFSNWGLADHLILDAFGEGARFKSNLTNSGGGARKYSIQTEWRSPAGESSDAELGCRDVGVVVWRSRWSPPLGS